MIYEGRYVKRPVIYTMNPDFCNCNEFEKAVDYNGIRYYKHEQDRFNSVKTTGWYIYDMAYQRPVASLMSFVLLSFYVKLQYLKNYRRKILDKFPNYDNGTQKAQVLLII